MTASELKERLTEEDIKVLLTTHMNAEISYEDDVQWISTTVCHHGTSQKLYYYKDSMAFHCYTECGQMDILGLVIGFLDIEDDERKLYKAINWICKKINIDNCEYGFGNTKEATITDWDFIKKIKGHRRKKLDRGRIEKVVYDSSIMKIFTEQYYQGWIDEGISIESMQKYSIMYSTWQQRIIIPHYDIGNNLVGVRGRAMLEDDVEQYGKYTPFRIGKYFFNHTLGQNLYGLNQNIKAVQDKRKIMLVEAEKSVLQTDTMFGDDNFTVALCGSKLTDYQMGMIRMLGVREVIVALDRQYEVVGSKEYDKWIRHINKYFNKPLSPYVKVTVLLDTFSLLPYKASPTDMGKETLLELMDNKIYVGTVE